MKKNTPLDGWSINEKGTLINGTIIICKLIRKDYALRDKVYYKVQDHSGVIKSKLCRTQVEALLYVNKEM